MPHEIHASPANEPTLDDILAQYIASEEAGNSPDRQKLLAQHSQFAADLTEFFANRDHMQRLAEPLRGNDASDRPSGPLGKVRYFGDYELLEEVAAGGMGIIYRARQRSLNRIVAVKMILKGTLARDEDVKRFRAEAEAAASLQHPAIVAIHEIGLHEGQHYFSMDYVEGHSLAELPREQPLSAHQAAETIHDAAEAVHYAHQQGTLHRDLKPSNILIDRQGRVRITDFGLAKRIEGNSDLTLTGQILGTPSYMPPEQASGKRSLVAAASDIYSLGAVLYELLTGRPPFRGESPAETLRQVESLDPISPRLLSPTTPRDLETICLKCLEKEPHKRYGTAQLLAEDLGRFLLHEPILARPVGPASRAWRWCRRRPTIAALSLTIMLSLIVGTSTSTYYAFEAEERAIAEKNESTRANLREQEALQAKGLANEQRQLAVQRANELKLSNEQLGRQAGALEQQTMELRTREVAFYRSLLKLAHSQTQGNSIALADENLNKFPEEFRGWAWRYAKRLCHPEFLTLKGAKCISMDPSGERLATATGETIALYDLPSGTHERDLKGHAMTVLGLAFVDSERLVSVSSDGTSRLWNIDSGEQQKLCEIGCECVKVAVGPTGNLAAIAGSDGKVRLWNLVTGETIQVLEHGAASVLCLTFSPDGELLATGTRNPPSVRFWNTSTGEEDRRSRDKEFVSLITFAVLLEGNIEPGVHDLAYSSDGKTLAVAQADSLLLVDLERGLVRKTLSDHFGGVRGVSFSSDGRWIASASSDGAVRIWDAVDGRCQRTLPWHTGVVSAVAFCSSHPWLASADESAVKVWSLSPAWDVDIREMHTDAAYCLAFDGKGKRLVTGGGRHSGVRVEPHLGEVRVLDTANQSLIFNAEFAATSSLPVVAVAISADGTRVAAAGRGGTLHIWNVDTQELTLQVKKLPGQISSLAFHPEHELLLVAGFGGVVILDCASGNRICNFPGAEYAAFGPDGKTVYGSGGGFLTAWDLATQKVQFRVKISPDAWRLAISPDDQILALALDTRFVQQDLKGDFVQLRNARSGSLIRTLKSTMHRDYADKDLVTSVYGVAFSPDGRELVTGSGDKTARIWDVATGDELLIFPHSNQVFCVAFSPDGRRLASAGGHWSGPRPGEVRIWDASLP